MSRTRLIIAAMFAVFAFAAIASAAQAAPSITVEPKAGETKTLGKGETRNVKAKAFSPTFILEDKTSKLTFSCKEVALKNAVLLGAASGTGYTADGQFEFKTCRAEENGKPCASVAEPITTVNLKGEGVELTDKKTGAILFKPETGKTFSTIGLGAPCVTSVKVTGEEVVIGFFDEEGTKGAKITLQTAKLPKKSWILATEATQPAKVIQFSGGVEKETEVHELDAGGTPAAFVGEALVELTSGEKWSPLA
jgi:hypothetical protein